MKDGAAHMWRYWCLGTQPYVPCPATAMNVVWWGNDVGNHDALWSCALSRLSL